MMIFLMKSESFLPLHWELRNYHIQGPDQKDIIYVIHETPVVLPFTTLFQGFLLSDNSKAKVQSD